MSRSKVVSTAAFDLGTHYGYCTRNTQGEFSVGSNDLKTDARIANDGFRYLMFEKHVRSIFEYASTEVVFFEEVRAHSGVTAAHVYGGFKATLTKVCEDMGVAYCSLSVGTIKKMATGRGDAGKARMLEAAQFYVSTEDHNAADAFWCNIVGIVAGLKEVNRWTAHLTPTKKTRKRKGSALS